MKSLNQVDIEIFNAIENEKIRQNEGLELIASENFTSNAVLEAQSSVMTNKYAEGYPGKRDYGGCKFVDVAESLAIERAKRLFKADHANVQPHSGTQANMAVYFACLELGDTVLGMEPKTKNFAKFLKDSGLADKGVLFIMPGEKTQAFMRASRNIQSASSIEAKSLNAYEILRARKIVLFVSTIKTLVDHFYPPVQQVQGKKTT